jgi:hypothetical protein
MNQVRTSALAISHLLLRDRQDAVRGDCCYISGHDPVLSLIITGSDSQPARDDQKYGLSRVNRLWTSCFQDACESVLGSDSERPVDNSPQRSHEICSRPQPTQRILGRPIWYSPLMLTVRHSGASRNACLMALSFSADSCLADFRLPCDVTACPSREARHARSQAVLAAATRSVSTILLNVTRDDSFRSRKFPPSVVLILLSMLSAPRTYSGEYQVPLRSARPHLRSAWVRPSLSPPSVRLDP